MPARMNQHSLLIAVGLCVTTAVATTSDTAAADTSVSANGHSRPNIVFLLTDDQRDNTLSAMGHPFVKTPNVDRLLRQSTRFRNA
jgi:hypothetical protein